MLTPEQIKKLIEIAKPDGFRFTLSGDSKLGGGYMEYMEQPCSVFGLYMPESIMYPLFLQKCIEGINRSYLNETNNRWVIEVTLQSLDIWDGDVSSIVAVYCYDEKTNMDKIKEQALIYILDNIQKQD